LGDLFAVAAELSQTGRVREALPLYRDILRRDPGNVNLLQHVGVRLNQVGELAEAEQILRTALSLSPDHALVRQALAINLMSQGQYAEGWRLYESRHQNPALQLPTAAALPFPQWQGESLAGKRIVIFPEQGFGDHIQFARFIPQMQADGAEVTVLTRPELVTLFVHSFPDVNVMAAVGAVEFPDPHFWAMGGGLVGRLGVTLQTLPSKPYLKTPAIWPPLPAGFKIGVQLRGNPHHKNDINRSLPPEAAAQLRAELPGQVISLEPAATGAQDFAQTAALIEQLDLVIAVDTSVAHLAGALGRRCFVLLPAYDTDWRWLRDRSDSPWYPSLRLYRRDLDDADWTPTLGRLVSDVRALAQSR
jgi:hypothetical protein